MIELRELVDGLERQHDAVVYDADRGLFSSRGRAAVTIETLRKILAQVLKGKADSRMLSLEGKGNGVYIYVPRIQYQWHPGEYRTPKEELNYVVAELKKDLGI